MAELARAQGVEITESAWLDERPQGLRSLWSRPRVLLVGARNGELSDVFVGRGRFSTGGRLYDLSPLASLTRTPTARERALVTQGTQAAWLVEADDQIAAVELATFEPLRSVSDVLQCWVLELDSCPGGAIPETRRDWTYLQRWQDRITNGQTLGVAGHLLRFRVRLHPPAPSARVEFLSGTTHLHAHGASFVVGAAPSGESPFVPEPDDPAPPGDFTTWLAETLRETPLGEQGVAQLKALGFLGRDYATRAANALLGSEPEELVTEDLGGLFADRLATVAAPSESGWPPAPLTPPLGKPVAGEGVWMSLDDDPFVVKGPDGRSPFVLSFVRPDPKRPYVRVYVVLWDPRRVELHMVGGSVEPKSSTGERGSGRIPRDPKVLGRLAGAFNGAFRTRHGAFGMAAGGSVYLPPKAYAATVATLDDGSTALGTWPDRPGLPRELVSFRQNLTPLVQDQTANPYRRHYWGGLPEGWQHESLTVRTALCLTRDGFLAYLYGDHLDPSTLVTAALAAGCTYALHLDMNAGHTGFELYRVAPSGQLPSLDAPLEPSWQARGSVLGAPGYEFLARRLTKHMPLMNFPRYVHREQRDFFYLTLRPALGLRPLPAAWKARGPAGGWHLGDPGPRGAPTAWAHAKVNPFPETPERHMHLLALDPRRLRAASLGDHPTVIEHSRFAASTVDVADANVSGTSSRAPTAPPLVASPQSVSTSSTEARSSSDSVSSLPPFALITRAPGVRRCPAEDSPRTTTKFDDALGAPAWLWWEPRGFALGAEPPGPHAVCLTGLGSASNSGARESEARRESGARGAERRAPESHATSHDVVALVGVDADGLLVYADFEDARTLSRAELDGLVTALDLTEYVPLRARIPWRFGQDALAIANNMIGDVSRSSATHDDARAQARAQGSPPRGDGARRESKLAPSDDLGANAVALWAVEGPRAFRLFPDTPVVEPRVWAYRQLESLPLDRLAEASRASDSGSSPPSPR